MKYEVETLIKLPLKDVIKKMDSIDNLKHWQRGLVSADQLSGTSGKAGAKMCLTYKFGKRNMELIETITKNNFPNALHATYETKGMLNTVENYFTQTVDGNTIWRSKNDFKPSSFMLKIMTLLIPGAFKKQTKKFMNDFKNFAENGVSVANN